nr:IS3 family transposase [Exiguobacterium oxidotolerans]
MFFTDDIKTTITRIRFDNGPIESFWGALKCESYYLHTFEEFDELHDAIRRYIRFYNELRYQKRLNGLSPLEFRAQAV